MTRLARDGDAWRLPFEGLRVSQIRIDYAFGLEFAEDQERATDEPWRLRINTSFRYRRPGVPEAVIDPEGDPTALAPALSVRHQTLAHGRVHADGHLSLRFTDGDAIDVPAHDRYEAWEAYGGSEDTRTVLVSPIAPDTWT